VLRSGEVLRSGRLRPEGVRSGEVLRSGLRALLQAVAL
jgi:hypothetical protein